MDVKGSLLADSVDTNSAYAWDSFDPTQYVQDNYARLIEDDRQILHMVRDFFIANAPTGPVQGVDVGAGANLYPAMSMLPFCEHVTLFERSRANLRWLEGQVPHFDPLWEKFWAVLAMKPDSPYGTTDARPELHAKVRLEQGDLFDLPRHRWGMGTMFFVAESMSGQLAEFDQALHKFVASLRPGSPFAAAFMAESPGYTVGGVAYPAVPVTTADVSRSLEQIVDGLVVEPVFSGEKFREGYQGMILALGRAGAAKTE